MVFRYFNHSGGIFSILELSKKFPFTQEIFIYEAKLLNN